MNLRVWCAVALLAVLRCSGVSVIVSPPPEVDSLARLKHTIAAKPIPISGTLVFAPDNLPEGARGTFASFDGDSFTVHFAPRQSPALSAEEVFTSVVAPLMRGMGFGDRIGDMRMPEAKNGVVLPGANLAALAAETCREVDDARYKRFHAVCKAMKTGETNEAAEREFDLAYGMSFVQFKADAERPRIQYVFTQAVDGVPIEHSAVIAERRDGEAITSVHGSLFNRYQITNAVNMSAAEAIGRGAARLGALRGLDPSSGRGEPEPSAELVLLPYGAGSDPSVVALRYVFRTLLFARPARAVSAAKTASPESDDFLSWMAWIDAQNGPLLQLSPQFSGVSAKGRAWKRDPQTPVEEVSFTVDAASGEKYVLKREDVFERVADHLNKNEVEIAATGNGSGPALANFDQEPMNDPTGAICSSVNNAFRQVNAYAHLHRYRKGVVSAGTFPTFPESEIEVRIDVPGDDSKWEYTLLGRLRLSYGAGEGLTKSGCPDNDGQLPAATDATALSHEMAHLSTARLSDRRPKGPRPSEDSRTIFHDFADAWAHAYTSTPCIGGWMAKNVGGTDARKNCAIHDEYGGIPRLASVREPFVPSESIEDHFPEKRHVDKYDNYDGYANGQIVATALWLTRQGLRSKNLAAGTAEYWIRINHALYNYGFVQPKCTECDDNGENCESCDLDIYLFARDMLEKLTVVWATAGSEGGCFANEHDGAHTTNKLLSAWARVGIFLVPFRCIDNDSSTTVSKYCEDGEDGGDAIVDVSDEDTGDDVMIDGVVHPEEDYVKRGGVLPKFRVWTGPRFKFDEQGTAQISSEQPHPCNAEFQVELASDPGFTAGLVTSEWQPVSTTSDCYGTYRPPPDVWLSLGGSDGDVKVYYRVRTRDRKGQNEKLSTEPGNGAYTVPAPYVVVNNDGQP